MRRVIFLAVLAVSCYWLVSAPWAGDSAQELQAEASFLFDLANLQIRESSGVAASTRTDNVYWTHNDSGGSAELFAFDAKGKDLGTFNLAGVRARDWEDMASVRINGVSFLYIGDIGDNMEDQRRVFVHRIIEPDPRVESRRVAEVETFALSFPDGPKNCEALLVTPTGDLILVTKSETGKSGVYKAPKPQKDKVNRLERLGTLDLGGGNRFANLVTGGDVSPSGDMVVIRTYFSVKLYRTKSASEFLKAEPEILPVPLERQGEAVCFDLRNRRLLTTSEGSPCRVRQIALPK